MTIIKDVNPEPDTTDFSFTATGTGLSNFSLDDDGVNTGPGGDIKNTTTFSGLAVGGNFTVTEDGETGYSLAGPDLHRPGHRRHRRQHDRRRGDHRRDLAAGQAVTCTYTQRLSWARSRSYKDVNPEPDATDFSFSATGTGLQRLQPR